MIHFVIKQYCLFAICILYSCVIFSQTSGIIYQLEKPIYKDNFITDINLLNYIDDYQINFNNNNGFALKCRPNYHNEVSYILSNKYSLFSCILFCEPNSYSCKINIIGDNVILFSSVLYEKIPIPLNLDVSDVNVLKIQIEAQSDTLEDNSLQNNSYDYFEKKIIVSFFEPILYSGISNNSFASQVNNNDTVFLIQDIQPKYLYKFKTITQSQNKSLSDFDCISVNNQNYYSGLIYKSHGVEFDKNVFSSFYINNNNYNTLEFVAGPISAIRSHGTAKLLILGDNKIIFSKTFNSGDRLNSYSVDISGYKNISFCINEIFWIPEFIISNIKIFTKYKSNDYEDTHFVGKGVYDLISSSKLLSFNSANDRYRLFYDGNNNNRYFWINNKKYYKGFILNRALENVYTHRGYESYIGSAYALFELDNKYDFLDFSINWLRNGMSVGKDTLCVYADSIIMQIPLHPLMKNHYSIPTNKCKNINFILNGEYIIPSASYAVTDLILRNGAHQINKTDILTNHINNNLKIYSQPDFYVTNKCKLINNNLLYKNFSDVSFYIINNLDTIYDGVELKANYLENYISKPKAKFSKLYYGHAYNNSIIIHYNYLDTLSADNYYSIVQYDKTGNVYSHAYASYSLDNQYDSVSFTIGVSIGNNFGYYETIDKKIILKNKLYLVCDDVFVEEVDLNSKMYPITVTISINRCKKLLFWIPSSKQINPSYVIYNLKFH